MGALLLAGCVTVSEETVSPVSTGTFPQELKVVSQMRSVKAGMLKSEVRSLLDESITIGYQQTPGNQSYAPITLNNPYRVEISKEGDRVFGTYYYFTGIKQADGKITDDELVPVVFENDKLVGKGWSFFKKSIQPSN